MDRDSKDIHLLYFLCFTMPFSSSNWYCDIELLLKDLSKTMHPVWRIYEEVTQKACKTMFKNQMV